VEIVAAFRGGQGALTMEPISLLGERSAPLRVLALGAHCDDIEIGCGGTLLRLAAERERLEVRWAAFSSTPERAEEGRKSAAAFLQGISRSEVTIGGHRDGFLPDAWAAVKEEFEAIRRKFTPDLIFTHYRHDLHQDHRVVSELTWNTWRRHLILEYEIPKYDGDLGVPNMFAPLSAVMLERKIALLLQHFPTQAGKSWFTPELFRALPRIRGMECAAAEGLAEAFYCRKAVF
jgi:LmbE family N-acetylglucosaminyl deacetylase